jgi:hypothetical protein
MGGLTTATRIAAEILRNRKLLFWIGAGNSFTAGIPMDSDDHEGLAYRLALIFYENSEEEVRKRLGEQFRLADLARVIEKHRVRDLILQQGWGDFRVAEAHRALSAISAEGFPVELVTVNYDPLIENGLDQEGLEPRVICAATDYRELADNACFVVKVHGCPFRCADPATLVMLIEELAAPPAWVIQFLNGRLPERVFVYVGFSGNAQYVKDCVSGTATNLEGRVIESYGVDVVPSTQAFGGGHSLGDFYRLCHVPEENYTADGSDVVFRDVANIVFRQLATDQLELATPEARLHGCDDTNWLRQILRAMSYEQIRAFARKLAYLSPEKITRIRNVAMSRAFKWMLLLVCRGILRPGAFQPVLAFPYHPRLGGSGSVPVIFFDGLGHETSICCADIASASRDTEFRRAFQLGGLGRWYAVIVNCAGHAQPTNELIVQREAESTVREYVPVVYVDENTLVDNVDLAEFERIFQT